MHRFPISVVSLFVSFSAVSFAAAGCGGSTNDNPGTGDAGETQDSGGTTHDAGFVETGSHDAVAPVEAGLPPGVVAVPLYSCQIEGASYTAGVTLGGTQQFQMILDTGSTTLGVASSMCSGCGTTSAYTPGTTAVDQKQMATSQYGSGSWTGEIYQDGVTLGTAKAAPVNLVAIDTQSMFFQMTRCDSMNGGYQGILGMGPGAAAVMGTNGYFDQFVATTKLPDVFATELCTAGGTLWLGGYDPAATTAAPQYTPIQSKLAPQVAQFYYSVELTSITANGTMVPMQSGQFTDSVVDTGTSVFLVGSTVFSALATAIASDATFTQLFGGASFFPASAPTTGGLTCASVSQTKDQLDAMLPELTLTFDGGATVKAKATEAYLFNGGGNQWCPAMIGQAQSLQMFPFATLMGAPILKSSVVIFDRAQKRIGFAPHTACP